MSRITKWKFEKAKVKVVFRLQFHATNIPQTGWEKLFISFIPTESGKATAKTTKANVKNGTCKWGDAIYETTRLLQDVKSKQFEEKLYKLVVIMGSTRSSILGEAIINLADYADALNPSAVELPLHGCSYGTILHVTVQLLTSKTGFREFEQQRELREKGLQLGTDLNKHAGSGFGKVSSPEETAHYQIDKVNARVRFRPESKNHPSLEEVGVNGEYADSTVGFDGSSNNSESLYAEKHDTSSTNEVDSLKSTVSGDLNGLSNSHSPQTEKGDPSGHRNLAQGSSEWVPGWGSDYSMDNDLAIAHEENSRLKGSLEVAETSIFELKLDVSSLQSHADEIGIETQKFSHQLAAEIASSEKLAKEVSVLKSECSKFKDDLGRLKNLKVSSQLISTESSQTEQDHLLQDKQPRWLNGLLIVEDRIRELQNKAYLGFDERDLRFLHSDLKGLLIMLQDLKQGSGEATGANINEIRDMSLRKSEQFVSGTGFDVDLYDPESILHYVSIPNLVSQETESTDAAVAMREKTFDLLRQLDEAKDERESLTRKMDQMECYYEALVHELEENQKQMLVELQNLRNEHSTCLYSISTNKAEMEAMRQEMHNQMTRFSEERCDQDSLNKELEQRAITSEAALKRARLNYSIAVNQLQKDLDLLSTQVLSMFENNENLIKQTYSENSQPCFQGYRDLEQNQNTGTKKQVSGGDFLLEDLQKSLLLQEDLYHKVEEELIEMHSANLYLDVFSKTLQETLVEANRDIKLASEKMIESAEQLDFSIQSRDLLLVKLQMAMRDVNDILLQNQILEAKLESDSKEKCLLMQKITEYQAQMMEYRCYESKYEACSFEKSEMENLLKLETLENDHLRNEMFSLKAELRTAKAGLIDSAVLKENMQKIVNFLRDKLKGLLTSYDKQFGGISLLTSSDGLDLELKDFKGIIMQLEEIQHNTCQKIQQLEEEKKDLEDDRDKTAVSLSTARSEILGMELNFKNGIGDMVAKLDLSNDLVEKLQLKLEILAKKCHFSLEAEEKYSQQNRELFADLARFESELQELTFKSSDLSQEILDLNTIAEELERSKLTVSELLQDKQDLTMSLQGKTEESAKLSSELDSLKESLKCLRDGLHDEKGIRNKLESTITDLTSQLNEEHDKLLCIERQHAELVHFSQLASDLTSQKSAKLASELDSLKESLKRLHDELHDEKGIRNKLESTVTDLTSQLNEEHDKLLCIERQNAELAHFRQLALDLELENSRIFHLLLQHEECQDILQKESSSCNSVLESQLSEMHECSIAAVVQLTFVRTQYETLIEKLVLQLQASDGYHRELENKNLAVEEVVNRCLASEAHYIEENAKLATTIENLKSELEASVAQNRVFSDSNNVMMTRLEETKERLVLSEVSFAEDNNRHALIEEQLKHMLSNAEEEIANLIFSKEELEIIVIVMKEKLDEHHALLTLTEEYNDGLRNQCKELTQRISEQIMKTEEFKNLSVHLKELKDEAEAECLLVREKRASEGPSVAMQESLRIAFIKEQYETSLEELRQQLSISKTYGEEMLYKLQDVINETENRRKSEASLLKRNEELSLKILELEAELHSVLSEKRENVKEFDRLKAELECALLSLECCKEEKDKLEASLQECEEKSKIDYLDRNGLMDDKEVKDASSISIIEGENSNVPLKPQSVLGVLVSRDLHGIPEHEFLDLGDSLPGDGKHLAITNDHFRSQSLKSSMEHLHNELERMKVENSQISQINNDPKFQDLRREIIQLDKANQELGSIFPLFNELSSSGNALERIFALEIELAEALRSKHKSSINFQSSFLKQHGDEEAVFKSFRDINELIKEMLELKGRYATVETDLKEMQDRYSQLSLQFAEVEGERQRLMMTLKNVRATKKLSRSSSATLGDLPL